MGSLIHADIFFFITTIAVILLTLILGVVLIYLVQILRDLKHISRKAKSQSDLIAEDIDEFRKKVRSEGLRVSNFLQFIMQIFRRNKKRPSTKK